MTDSDLSFLGIVLMIYVAASCCVSSEVPATQQYSLYALLSLHLRTARLSYSVESSLLPTTVRIQRMFRPVLFQPVPCRTI